ncbi:hypothetical protein GOODEAATRI_016574 [Goodea atripinnis]|uniref:Transferrin-like domain-containing protein n=1 Tax=Goodea atripinnis TaxID=208336 RepID=A0ABV0MSP4_9TELE
MPLGYLIDQGFMSVMGCNIPQGVANFFNASCIPGANNVGDPASLCELCKGDGSGMHKCEMSEKEMYYSYEGAFRSRTNVGPELAKNEADAITLDGGYIYTAGKDYGLVPAAAESYTGNSNENWAVDLLSKDFQLLCSQGTVAEVTQYRLCNLARVPSHAVMVRPDTNIHAIYGLLDRAQTYFSSDTGSGFKMFDSEGYSGTDLIFKDSTVRIVGVGDKKTYQEWLGQGYMNSLVDMECNSSSAVVSSAWLLLMALLSAMLTNV